MRKFVIIFLCCTTVLLAGYSGYRGYKIWKQNRMMNLARAFAAKGDTRNTVLCLQQVLRANPQNLEASRTMASLLEAGRSPGALLWRNRILELNPKSLDDRLALVQTALLFRDYTTATNTLTGVDAAGMKTAGYHNVAGAVAASTRHLREAEAHFLEAARLEPANGASQLNLAVVRLQGTNAAALLQARSALASLSANPTNVELRCQALRELIKDASRHREPGKALEFSQRLVQETNAPFSDRLLRLDVLRSTTNAAFKPALATCQREAADNPGKVYELANWQLVNTSPAETLAWLRSLPADSQTNQPAAWLIANCYALLRDWRAAEASLKNQNWGELEFVRHAYLSRAQEGQQLAGAAKAEWELALKTANDQKAALRMLWRMASDWGRQSNAEELLWALVNRYPDETWASQALMDALFTGGRTRSLLQLFTLESRRHPSSLSFKNNLAMMALLLDAMELKPHDLAREVYRQAPTNSDYASTFAFSLYLQEKHAEALKVLEQLDPKALETPPIAGYYAMVLKANGMPVKASAFFKLAGKARLLPEERRIIDQAKTDI